MGAKASGEQVRGRAGEREGVGYGRESLERGNGQYERLQWVVNYRGRTERGEGGLRNGRRTDRQGKVDDRIGYWIRISRRKGGGQGRHTVN